MPLPIKQAQNSTSRCTTCGAATCVVDSRLATFDDLTVRKRRRECTRCGCRFSTHEVPQDYLRGLIEDRQKHRTLAHMLHKSLTDAGYILDIYHTPLVTREEPVQVLT